MSNLFHSLISLVIALFFVLIGLISIMIPWSADIRYKLIHFILEDALAISLFGFAFIVVGSAIIANILLNARHQYYHIRSGVGAIKIETAIIQQHLTLYFKELFPSNDIPCRIAMKKNKIHITIDLPFTPPTQQRELLERIKGDIQHLFATKLGYLDEFFLSASFHDKNKTG